MSENAHDPVPVDVRPEIESRPRRGHFEYDVALSLYRPDPGALEIGSRLADHLRREGLKVFFYRSEREARDMLGQDLEGRLVQVYGHTARLVVVVLSPRYATDGPTRREWGAISRRRDLSPDERFLVAVSTTDSPPPALAGTTYEYVGEYAWEDEAGIGLRRVVRTVLQRLGRRPWLWSLALIALLTLSVGSVAFRWSRINGVSPDARWAAASSIGLALVWFVAFVLTPRWFPGLVYRPHGKAARAYQGIFLNVFIDRLTFVAVLSVAVLAHALLPQWQLQIQTAIQEWLTDDPDRRAGALRFFTSRLGRDDALELWAPILVGENHYGGRERGKALDMVCRLMTGPATSADPNRPPRDVTDWLARLGEARRHGLDSSNYRNALGGVDATGIDLDRTDLSSLSLAGKETTFTDARLQQSRLVGDWFWATNLERVNASWCDFTSSTFAGVVGRQARFGGAVFAGCSLLGCDLSGADFSRADLTGVQFSDCTLAGAKFTNAYLTGARFERCDLSGAVFTDPDVQQVGVWGDLAGVLLIDCRMGGVLIKEANLEGKARKFVRRRAMVFGESKTVFSVNGAAGVPNRGGPVATLSIPSAALIRCQFRYAPKKAGDPAGSGVDWSGAKTAGVLLDIATSRAMSAEERAQFDLGGFNPGSVSRPRPDGRTTEEQYPGLRDRTWDSLFHQLVLMHEALDRGS
jgi:uncharacterized protein YjbI with pentapeptide repeats